LKPVGISGASREPEGQTQLRQLIEVDHIAITIEWLTPLIVLWGAAGWRVVTSRRWTFDDETIHSAGRLAGEDGGQRVARDDGQELGPPNVRWCGAIPVLHRIERQMFYAIDGKTFDFELQGCRTVLGQCIERTGDLTRDPGPHEDVIHSGENSAIVKGDSATGSW
jgi:hypothetical protein